MIDDIDLKILSIIQSAIASAAKAGLGIVSIMDFDVSIKIQDIVSISDIPEEFLV